MPSASWVNGWAVDDLVSVGEFSKGIGCISDSTLSGSAASFDITGIPAVYAHLMIVLYARGTASAATIAPIVRFNNDSSGVYNDTRGTGQTGISVSASGNALPAATATANLFGGAMIFVPHYAGTSNFKSLSSDLSAFDSGGSEAFAANAGAQGGVWKSAAAINRITILPSSGSWAAGSRCSIYVMGA